MLIRNWICKSDDVTILPDSLFENLEAESRMYPFTDNAYATSTTENVAQHSDSLGWLSFAQWERFVVNVDSKTKPKITMCFACLIQIQRTTDNCNCIVYSRCLTSYRLTFNALLTLCFSIFNFLLLFLLWDFRRLCCSSARLVDSFIGWVSWASIFSCFVVALSVTFHKGLRYVFDEIT